MKKVPYTVKQALSLTLMTTLFGCSSLKYNGLSESDVLFSIDNETQIASSAAESMKGAKKVLKPKSWKAKKALAKRAKNSIKQIAAPNWETELVPWDIVLEAQSTAKQCRLSTPTIQIDMHDFTSQVWLDVVDGKLFVHSTTDIDISKSTVGIKTESGSLLPFSSKQFSTSAVWSGSLVNTLEKNDAVQIIVSGDELANKTHEIAISLAPLKVIYPFYQTCSEQVVATR